MDRLKGGLSKPSLAEFGVNFSHDEGEKDIIVPKTLNSWSVPSFILYTTKMIG